MSSTLDALALWAVELPYESIPDAVVEKARLQRSSQVAAYLWGLGAEEAPAVLSTARTLGSGPFQLPGVDGGFSLEGALYALTGLSSAFDFEDYLLAAPSGPAAVWVPWLEAVQRQVGWTELTRVQVIVNEVIGRLGAASLQSLSRGASPIWLHRVGAALASGLLAGLGPAELARALALALGSSAPGSGPAAGRSNRIVATADALLSGRRAASLAAAGLEVDVEAIDREGGGLFGQQGADLRRSLGGLSQTWLGESLSYKRAPVSAWLQRLVARQKLKQMAL